MVARKTFAAMNAAQSTVVRSHYDRLSIFYRWLWGEHIHHGFWRDGESPREAQVALVKELANRAAMPTGATVLDVGCGLGGSAFWLAENRRCSVLGITISPVQKRLAEKRSHSLGLSDRVKFLLKDVNELDFAPESFDVIWNIECTEHLADKSKFFGDSARLLRRAGRLALCAWIRKDSDGEGELIAQICSGMLCPSLATLEQYRQWMNENGLSET